MKKILVTLLVGLVGCGNLTDIIEDNLPKGAPLNVGEINATGHALTESLLGIQALSGGISGLAPGLGDQKGLGFAPAMRAAPGLAPGDPNTCANVEVNGTWEGPKTDYTAEQEEESAQITVHFSCPEIDGARIYSSVDALITYKDGSTGTTSIYEAETAATDTTDGNLFTGYVVLDVFRYFPAGDERKSAHAMIEMDLGGGTFDAPAGPQYYRRGYFLVIMATGAEVEAEIIAETPVKAGDEMEKGTATRTTIHAEGGDLVKTSEAATITGKDIGSYSLENEYKDGGKDSVKVTSDGTVVTVDAKGRDGFVRVGSLNLTTGAFELTTTFPAGSVITTIVEKGTWLKGATSGSYERIVTFADGHEDKTKLEVQISGDTINATFTHNDLSGDIELITKPTETSIKVNITNLTGDKASLDGTRYADGSAKLHYTKDLKATDVNPDEEGDFTFQADGSGTGTVVAKNDAGVKVTVTVVINADGTTEGDAAGDVE